MQTLTKISSTPRRVEWKSKIWKLCLEKQNSTSKKQKKNFNNVVVIIIVIIIIIIFLIRTTITVFCSTIHDKQCINISLKVNNVLTSKRSSHRPTVHSTYFLSAEQASDSWAFAAGNEHFPAIVEQLPDHKFVGLPRIECGVGTWASYSGGDYSGGDLLLLYSAVAED